MDTYKKIAAVVLLLVVMLSSIGIAQVSHICIMALDQTEQPCCEGNSCKTTCCNNEQEPVTASDCCADIVKYHNQDVNTTIREFNDVIPTNIIISLFTFLFDFKEYAAAVNFIRAPFSPPNQTGREIIISKKLLLI